MKKFYSKGIVFLVTTVVFWLAAAPFLWKNTKKDQGEILSLALVSQSRDRLKSDVIAEWLDLSVEKFTPLRTFSLREGAQKLLKTGLIKKVQLYKLEPSTLVVSYTLREPFATIANWKNLGVDEEGVAFPLSPFFTPKELPEIIFTKNSELDYALLQGIQFDQFPLAKRVLMMNGAFFPWSIAGVDLSHLDKNHPYGGEMVLTLKNGERRLFIRLWFDHFEETLAEFSPLLSNLGEGTGVDLRLSSRTLVF